MIKMKYPLAFTFLRFLIFIVPIFAHTWVETVNLVGSDGSFQDTGFPRGFGGREAGVDPDKINTYLLPPNGRSAGNAILSTDLICKDTQVNQAQSAGHPRLSASPNDQVSLAYHENGHVTKFNITDGKPEGRGTVFIYGTNNPSPKDTFLGIHRIWNEDGTGGDKRGKLLATRPFDDGRCYQPNFESTAKTRAKALGFASAVESPEVLCQSVVQLPSDAGSNGTYTLYWLWDWPTLDQAGNIFKNESYTTCIDININSNPASHASQSISANKDNEDLADKTCVQSDKKKNVNSKIAVANNSSNSKISSQGTVTKEDIVTKKESKAEEVTDKSLIAECKANRKVNVIPGSANSSKLNEGKTFSATGVMTAKGGKDKANTVAVKDQLEGKSQIMIDPKASPKIASDNPPKQPGSTISSPKDNKNSTKNATPPDQIYQKGKKEKISSEDKENEEDKGDNEDKEEDKEDKEYLSSNSLPISNFTEKDNKVLTKNPTPLDEVDKKETEKISTSEKEENLPSISLPISRVMRNKVYIYTGTNSNLDLVRTITFPR